jgi:hypothetical protein
MSACLDRFPGHASPSLRRARTTPDAEGARQCRDTGPTRGSPSVRSARRRCPNPSHGNPRDDRLVGGPRRSREGRGIEPGQPTLSLVEMPNQEKTRTSKCHAWAAFTRVAVLLERRPRRFKCLRRPIEVARDDRNLGLAYDTPRARHRLSRTAGEPSRAQSRRAAPWRCRVAPGPARRHARQRALIRREGHPR